MDAITTPELDILADGREFVRFSGQAPTRDLVARLVAEIERLRGAVGDGTPATDNSHWRQIKCADVQWNSIPGVSNRMASPLFRQCSPPTAYDDKDVERWHELTLGQLADRGEIWWRRSARVGLGAVATEVVKLVIDHAAAGFDVTRKADAYVPRPVKSLSADQRAT